MATKVVQEERIQKLNNEEIKDGDYVLYWMQEAQRAECNHALEYAIQRANQLGHRLLVVFGLMDCYPEANLRHYRFMLEGLKETQEALKRRGIKMVVRCGNPPDVALSAGERASLMVCDRGYLRNQREWRSKVSENTGCAVIQVETDVVVPVNVVSESAEYAARTIRPKIKRHLEKYLVELRTTAVDKDSLNLSTDGLDLVDIDEVLSELKIDRSVSPVSSLFRGGTSQARRLLSEFTENKLEGYGENRNQPQTDFVSYMSMYLHFGQISPLFLALQIMNSQKGSPEDGESFLEELTIRRELAVNFVNFNPDYDSFDCLPDWAKKTLREHKGDNREYIYTKSEMEDAKTHDRYWNAAMKEMKFTGYMHNYMRMYWGKKILEWCNTPEYAYRVALDLNNKYFIDGRDPNSYANVGWIFGLHDRPWKERPIFGKVRYMNASGLKRKCDIEAYVEKVERRIRGLK